MTIAVAYKWAANPQEAVVGPDGSVDLSRAKAAISEYDPAAIELARGLADAVGEELVGVSVGGLDAGSGLARKAALSRGVDRLVVVADAALAGAGAAATGLALAAAVAEVGDVRVVVTGDASVDEGARLVPAVLAGRLGWPALADVTAVRPDGDGLLVERAVGASSQTLRLDGPAVLAAASDAAVPRVPGMKDILAAGKKPVQELATPPLDGLAALTAVGRSRPALADRRRQIVTTADPAAAAAELVAALRAAGLL